MDKKVLIRLGIVAAIIIIAILLFSGNGRPKVSHGNKYEVNTTFVNKATRPTVKEVYLLMDPSKSMLGYMTFKGLGANDIKKNIVNNVSDPLDRLTSRSRYGANLYVSFFGSGDKANDPYKPTDISRLQLAMKGDKDSEGIFKGGLTMLGDMIAKAVDQVNDTTLSLFVSDMVMSYGPTKLKNEDMWLNKTDLANLGATIHSALTKAIVKVNEDKKVRVEVLLLQYYSDCNGKYYYDCTENQVNKGKSRFEGQLMKDRPYYIMVFGTKEMLAGLLDDGVFAKPEHFYTSFGLDDSDMRTGKLRLNFKPESSWCWDNSGEDFNAENMGTIWTASDLGEQAETFTVEFDHFDIPSYLSQDIEIDHKFYENSKVLSKVELDASNKDPKIMRYFVTLKPYNKLPETVEPLEFRLVSENKWAEEASINDDTNVELEELQGKTWGLSTIIKNIDKAYYDERGRGSDVVATVEFNVSKY